MIRVVLAGGGTAGHISPLIATAEKLGPDAEITCVGTPKGLETQLIPAAGLNLELIPPVPMPRKINAELLKLPMRLRAATKQAGELLLRNEADVVVGFGGYVSMPVYFAANKLRIPIVIHEQNVLPGLANLVAAQFATKVYTTFPETPLPGAEFLGLPVKGVLVELAEHGRESHREQARHSLGIENDLPCLLVTGGSQGAQSVNNAVSLARDELLADGVNIIHMWGAKNFDDSLTQVVNEETGAQYLPVAFLENMATAYSAVDLFLGRSGAGTVVETNLVGLPSIYVPLAVGNGEQSRNAAASVAAGASILIPDAEVTAARVIAEVTSRIFDQELLARMSAAGKALMPANSAQLMADGIISVAGQQVKKGSVIKAVLGVVRERGRR